MVDPATPTCDVCGDKFPGDPCKRCAKVAARAHRMPSGTRRRRKHGRREGTWRKNNAIARRAA